MNPELYLGYGVYVIIPESFRLNGLLGVCFISLKLPQRHSSIFYSTLNTHIQSLNTHIQNFEYPYSV